MVFGRKEPKKDLDKEMEELKKKKAELEEEILKNRSDEVDNKKHNVEDVWVAKMVPSNYEPAIVNQKTGEVLTIVEALAKILEQQDKIMNTLG